MAQAINAGYRSEILNEAIDNTTWTPVSFSFNPNNICIRLREAGDIKVSLDSLGTTFFTIPNGTSLTYDWNAGRSVDVIYLQASIVAGTAEIIATFEG
jgi:hypothetical protein